LRGTYCLHLSGTRDTPTLKIDVAGSSEALAGIYHTTPHPRRHDNLISHMIGLAVSLKYKGIKVQMTEMYN
jgi:hypothetical protein